MVVSTPGLPLSGPILRQNIRRPPLFQIFPPVGYQVEADVDKENITPDDDEDEW